MASELVVMLALVLVNGLFSGAEMAIVASRRGRLRALANKGDAAALAALKLASNPDRFLPTVQIGVTVVGALAAAYGGERMTDPLAAWIARAVPPLAPFAGSIALAAFVMAFSFVTLVLGELVPKRLALRNAEACARLAAPFIQLVARLATPLVWGLNLGTSAVMWLVGARGRQQPAVSVDDIEQLLEAGRAEGVLEAVEHAVAAEALRLGERTVRDVMRPRIDIDALDVDTPAEEIPGAIAMAGYSRLPVYEGSLDRILGYVSTQDVLRTSWMGWPIELRRMMRRAVFVPETMPLDRLLDLFRKERTQFAIVLDEYGGTDGLVTLDDVLSELVGGIHEERQADAAKDFVQRADGSWLVEGSATVEDLARRFEIQLESAPRDYATISGLVLAELERLPTAGDHFTWRGLVIEVLDMDGRRIDKLLVRRG
ncbi:MAG: HlyC/CorC family transporter [Planctomycetes bacterium]|nr:HlyC/CorC family transporter [Planctomycetota bacterium]